MATTDVTEARPNRLAEWFHQTAGFLTSVREELGKVTWPTKPELIKATRMIVIVGVLLGLLIGLLDWLLQQILVNGVAWLAR